MRLVAGSLDWFQTLIYSVAPLVLTVFAIVALTSDSTTVQKECYCFTPAEFSGATVLYTNTYCKDTGSKKAYIAPAEALPTHNIRAELIDLNIDEDSFTFERTIPGLIFLQVLVILGAYGFHHLCSNWTIDPLSALVNLTNKANLGPIDVAYPETSGYRSGSTWGCSTYQNVLIIVSRVVTCVALTAVTVYSSVVVSNAYGTVFPITSSSEALRSTLWNWQDLTGANAASTGDLANNLFMKDLLRSGSEKKTDSFYCDISLRRLGMNVRHYTVQCQLEQTAVLSVRPGVLELSILMLVFCLTASLVSLVSVLGIALSAMSNSVAESVVRSHISPVNMIQATWNETAFKYFVKRYISKDMVFQLLLRQKDMVNGSETTVTLFRLWDEFLKASRITRGAGVVEGGGVVTGDGNPIVTSAVGGENSQLVQHEDIKMDTWR